ncbi:SMP-30/gluconolactonase/LRE family protein [Entomomonas moraniae]|nr:SMP-30/gluconolactonase/LRE family protein [Entomomonas moraniae]
MIRKQMSKIAILIFLAIVSFGVLAKGLHYNEKSQSLMPIPASEQTIPTVTAELWLKTSEKNNVLEGIIFDNEGNLLFCDVTNQRVMQVSKDKQLTTLATLDNFSPGGLALHKDGRLFIAALNLEQGLGTIVAVNLKSQEIKTVIPAQAGYLPNDLVFDKQGGFYFTDFKGSSTQPSGGVYYISADLKTITPVLPNLAMANGLALSQDGKTLWATEFARNLLHRIELINPTEIAAIGSAIPYRFIGSAPDSMRIDADGNVYVAIYGQGRVMIFNRQGIPIGQILLPDRDKGQNLRSTSLAIHPKTNDLYIVTSDEANVQGANIFHAKVFTHGLPPN